MTKCLVDLNNFKINYAQRCIIIQVYYLTSIHGQYILLPLCIYRFIYLKFFLMFNIHTNGISSLDE